MVPTIDLWAAIKQMREMSKVGRPFSIEFMGCNYTKGHSTGRHKIQLCLLRSSTHQKNNQYSDFMLNLLDVETGKARQCWQPLLMFFNDQKIVINEPRSSK